MKFTKILAAFLAILMIVSLVACNKVNTDDIEADAGNI